MSESIKERVIVPALVKVSNQQAFGRGCEPSAEEAGLPTRTIDTPNDPMTRVQAEAGGDRSD